VFGAIFAALEAVTFGTATAPIVGALALVMGTAAAYALATEIIALATEQMCEDVLHYRWGKLIGETIGAIAGGSAAKLAGSSSGSGEIVNDVLDSERTGSALKDDFEKPIRDADNKIIKEFPATAKGHGFPDIVDNYAGDAQQFPLRNGATLSQIEGSNNGVAGRFEWIIDNGQVTHRMFVQGETINGVPITP